jgi:predicted transposase YbfD/YdcC
MAARTAGTCSRRSATLMAWCSGRSRWTPRPTKSRFSALCDRIEITDAVITADALHAQHAHAAYLHRRGGYYLLIVKRNQPGLHAQLAALPWRDVPVAYTKREHGHGRTERRTLKVTSMARGLAFPRAAQAIQITRRRKVKGKWSRGDLLCGHLADRHPGPPRPARRDHPWPLGIEDRLHWVRDNGFDEDRSQVRTAAGPRIMASLRNLVITILRLAGATSIAAALRSHARRPAAHSTRSSSADRQRHSAASPKRAAPGIADGHRGDLQ